jgi:hypothetical protein
MVVIMLLFTLQFGVISAFATETGNADLSELTVQQQLSDGTTKDVVITPEFSADVTEYSAVLDASCTKLLVEPITYDADSTADVVWPEMDPGDNVTYIDVTASDGTTKRYTINSRVPDGTEETTTEETQTETDTLDENTDEVTDDVTTVAADDGTVTYDRVVRVANKKATYVLVENVTNASPAVPDGYTQVTLEVKNKKVQAYTMGNGSSYYLVYALDSDGNLGLYSYDVETGVIQRFNTVDYGGSSSSDAKTIENLQNEYNSTKEELQQKNSFKLKIIILLALIILILFFLVLNLVLKVKELKSYDDEAYDEDYYDDDDEEEYDDLEEEQEDVYVEREERPYEKPVYARRKRKAEPAYEEEPVYEEPAAEPEEDTYEPEAYEPEMAESDDEDDFSDLNIDLTDSILAELTETSQKLEQSSRSVGKDVKKIVKENDIKDMEIPSFNTSNLPNPNRFKFDIPDDTEDDFEFFDLDD